MHGHDRGVELRVRQVYSACPPTKTHYDDDGRRLYASDWAAFMESLGLPPATFNGRRVLDVGCGSCEKASLYADWGASVTGLEMTAPVVALARDVIGERDVTLVNASLFDFQPAIQYDIVIADGVLHHCADTFEALKRCASFVAPGGIMVVGLVNVWGGFWWFKPARGLCRLLAPRDFHRRAVWGTRLFAWTRGGHESGDQDAYRRSRRSWAYDWFANPRWNAHRPATVLRWLAELGFEHRSSNPSLVVKAPATTMAARAIRAVTGAGPRGMALYWLTTRQPNMFYCSAVSRR
jgi:2-polyprenyl-3-methyl-5-hydroxy-6-metoxy-1,4-benzoquinol methylase